ARAWAALAAVHEGRGDLPAAVEAWRRAVELDPGDAAAANNLGYALERLGQPAQASDLYARALAVDPTYALAWFNLGDLALQHGEPEQAIHFYRGGLELAPGNEQARRNLVQAEALARGVPATTSDPVEEHPAGR
ncbi:MAG TPA: tetratricopeptide repeat protein, partial [Thermoanaerobaculia bacterium]|nr:tetratricopeptide repeat protein [Thermoanaerobaculia bacterium]